MRRYACIAALLGTLLSSGLGAPPAQAGGDVTMTAGLAGRSVPAPAAHPSRLETTRHVLLDLSIANGGNQDVQVGTIILRGRVVGLTFFDYQTSVNISVPAHTTVARQFSLDLSSLRVQAMGLFNADVSLLDQGRHPVASRRTAVDVRGSSRSVYSLFGLALALATTAAFVRAVLDLARHRLSSNRWRRAVRFLVPGLGLGLTLVFTLSAMRLFLVGPMSWIPLVAITSAAGFAMGYFTPTPEDSYDVSGPLPAAGYVRSRP
jgi:hypothetical protein